MPRGCTGADLHPDPAPSISAPDDRRKGGGLRRPTPGTRIGDYRCSLPGLAGFATYRREEPTETTIETGRTPGFGASCVTADSKTLGVKSEVMRGGERGIRTLETGFSRLHTFQACSFDRSDISPKELPSSTSHRLWPPKARHPCPGPADLGLPSRQGPIACERPGIHPVRTRRPRSRPWSEIDEAVKNTLPDARTQTAHASSGAPRVFRDLRHRQRHGLARLGNRVPRSGNPRRMISRCMVIKQQTPAQRFRILARKVVQTGMRRV